MYIAMLTVDVLPGMIFSLGIIGCILWYLVSSIACWYRLRMITAPSFLANFSYFWLAKTTYSGDQYWIHRELHRKYGPLVRIGPHEVLTDDPDIIKKISSARSLYRRGDWYLTGRFNPYYDNMFTILDPKAHAKARSRVAGTYSGRDSPAMESQMNMQVHTLVELLQRKYAVSGPSAIGDDKPLLDLGNISSYFTMDAITSLAFGQAFGYLRDETDHYQFLQEVRRLWPRMSTSADAPWLRALLFSFPVLRLFGPKATDKAGFGALMGVAEEYVGKRFTSDVKHEQDMLASFIQRGLSRTECEAEGLFMIIAGAESTASAIRSTLLHVMTSPSVYYKLKHEIREAVGGGRVSTPIKTDEAKRLPYLRAVIYEGIRMRPPLLGLFPKIVPPGGQVIHDIFLPSGTAICMNTSSLLRSTRLFGSDADVFRPERFLELAEAERSDMERNVELAFGYGQYMCVGKTVAFMELNKVIFELLRAFDFQLLSPMKPSQVKSYGVFIETDLRVRVSMGEETKLESLPRAESVN